VVPGDLPAVKFQAFGAAAVVSGPGGMVFLDFLDDMVLGVMHVGPTSFSIIFWQIGH